MTEQLVRGFSKPFAKRLGSITPVEWRFISVGSLIAVLACLEAAKWVGVPEDPGFNGSLLAGPAPVLAVFGLIVSAVACLIVGAFAVLLIADEAGMLCACIGLGGLAARCGSIRSVLQLSSGNGIFGLLGVESVLLFGLVCLFWIVLRVFSAFIRGKNVSDLKYTAPNETQDASLGERFSVLAVQMVAMAVCEMVLIQSDVKPQALIGVGLAGFVGSIAAYQFRPLSDGFWYWAGPSGVAVVAYLWALIGGQGDATGEVHGWFAALCRVTPLDYASIGTAGALLGYWSSRRWAQPQEDESEEEAAQ